MVAMNKYKLGKMTHAMFEGYALLEVIRNADNEIYNSKIIEANKTFESMFGVSCDKLTDKTFGKVLPEAYEKLLVAAGNIEKTDEVRQFKFSLDKTDRQFLARVFNLSGDRIVLFFIEVTLQTKAKDGFRLHEVLFENAHDIILYISLDGKIVNANKRACQQYGYTKEQLLTMTIHDIRHPDTTSEYKPQMQTADNDGITFECVHVRSNGQPFPVEVSAKSNYTNEGHFRVHIIRDISLRKENEEKITWLAKYDPLTGIPNRANFIADLDDEIKRSSRSRTRFAVMLFDIDKFKHINDHYGHEAGDLILRHVATSAQKVLRAGDKIGRFGGDEFVVLQTGINGCDDVETLAKRIQDSVSTTIEYKSIPLTVKISIGISIFPKDAIEEKNLLHCADKAMYKVKRAGGGAFQFFTPCVFSCSENRLCLDGYKWPEDSST